MVAGKSAARAAPTRVSCAGEYSTRCRFCCVFSKIECLQGDGGRTDTVRQRLQRLGLDSIAERLDAGQRLAFEDGVRLFACPDVLALGWLANRERERRHG